LLAKSDRLSICYMVLISLSGGSAQWGKQMALIYGFDIGTTSIGWAVIRHEVDHATGSILGMGVRIFPEARDPDGTPLNQTRRQKRMARRQLRRRKQRRRDLNLLLSEAGLLPAFSKEPDSAWAKAMALDPWQLRKRGLTEALDAYSIGRTLYHAAKHRHFRGRDLDGDGSGEAAAETAESSAEEKQQAGERQSTLAALKASGETLGQHIASFPPGQRKRGVHASRAAVQEEFERLWTVQSRHNPGLTDTLKAHVADVIFTQKPAFWRKSTLGACRLMPGEPLAPKGSWLSQQRRMLEKLNNLEIASGNRRPLDSEERAAILAKLQTQASMGWGGVRKALAPLYALRGVKGLENRIRFNLELGGDAKLLGNPLEARLADIFGEEWQDHPHRQAIRDRVPARLWRRDYQEVGTNRVVIRAKGEREADQAKAEQAFRQDFGVSAEQAQQLGALKLPTGWEPYSTAALQAVLPHLEAGARFGALMVSPEYTGWRAATFADREQPTGEILDRLPSPRPKKLPNGQWDRAEEERLKSIRNPTVARTQNELRKVVNNLIDAFGKPDLIRVELAREVGLSKREREERQAGIRKNEKRRGEAKKDLESKGVLDPSPETITKWVLWKESQERCPYTGDQIGFDALFRNGEFDIEHIWPRGRSLDDSQGNKTLCRKDVNIAKGARTPFEFYRSRPDEWASVKLRLDGMTSSKGGPGLPRGKVKRFVAETMPDDFAARQLVDTGYAARQAVALLKRLWPDVGPEAPVNVQAVTGKVTSQLRKLWGLNNILSRDGEKSRADHRHHAIDALTVACAHPGMTQRLSSYWQLKDDPAAPRPELPAPWPAIRRNAEEAVEDIVVSHRVRKKVSGALHEDTVRGDTGRDVGEGRQQFRLVVSRKPVEALTNAVLSSNEAIVDPIVRERLRSHVAENGGDVKRAFATYPRVSGQGPPIKRVRIQERRQLGLMANVANGWADAAGNHHVAIWRNHEGKAVSEVVSLLEASRRLASRAPIVQHDDPRGRFVMSLAPGDTLHIPAGDRAGYWVVEGVWAAGPIIIVRASDAAGTSVFRPRAESLLATGARKVSVDPIGRVRPAND
jgi:CRISPR-associated endonuclease Csn1